MNSLWKTLGRSGGSVHSAGVTGGWAQPPSGRSLGTTGPGGAWMPDGYCRPMAGIIVLLLILGVVIVMAIVATSGSKDHAGH